MCTVLLKVIIKSVTNKRLNDKTINSSRKYDRFCLYTIKYVAIPGRTWAERMPETCRVL
jgi:hypothetical protein